MNDFVYVVTGYLNHEDNPEILAIYLDEKKAQNFVAMEKETNFNDWKAVRIEKWSGTLGKFLE